jgi:signal transduction histidine kinase
MKLRENCLAKVLAFLLAVAGFTAAAGMGWYQLMNYGAIWGEYSGYETGPGDGYTVRYLEQMDYSSLRALLYYYNAQELGSTLSVYSAQEQTALEERFAAGNTNLRWQVRGDDGTVMYGNAEGDIPAQAEGLYYTTFEWTTEDSINVTEAYGDPVDFVESAVNAGELQYQTATDDWLEELRNLSSQYTEADTAPFSEEELNTIFTGQDGMTELLIIETSEGVYVYGPTVMNCVQENKFGYRYDLTEGWVEETATGEQNLLDVVMWLDKSMSVDDHYLQAYQSLSSWKSQRVFRLGMTIVFAAAGLLCTVYLCWAAGHRRDRDGIYLNWFHRIPGDLLLAVVVLLGVLLYALVLDPIYRNFCGSLLYGNLPMFIQIIIIAGVVAAAAALGIGALLTFVARCKAHVLLKNTLIWRFCRWLVRAAGKAADAVPLIWKAALIGVGYGLFTFIVIVNRYYHYHYAVVMLLWMLITAAGIVYLCLWAYQWQKIRKGTREIIGGNPDYHINTEHMLPDLRRHADELNNLGQSISAAVEERMRSERFKAELITNVSHDLKTPLTSIINYVDLLKKEQIENPRAAEYIDVLDRKSQRLKKLTEDLVEASKASTGNLAVMRERISLTQLADQALAEYEERLSSQNLRVIRTFPEEEVWVEADGRHLWRVVDNLLSNCAKYALEGTRIYVEVSRGQTQGFLSLKNISRDPLNVPPEALVERFVRGDESRTTEGSGLGLSIAQSLTELQKGTFRLIIDGDLFKAEIALPLAEDEPADPV